jgi:hypothetical protein
LVCGSGEPKIRAALLLSYNPLPVRVDSSFAVFLAATCKRAPGAPVVQFLDLASKILTVWLVSLTIHLIVYVMTTAVVIHSYRFFWKRGLAEHKIQEREASPADIRREIRSSLGTVLIFSVIYAGVYFGAGAGVFTIYLGIHPLGWVYMLFSIAAIIVAHDAYFYRTHRCSTFAGLRGFIGPTTSPSLPLHIPVMPLTFRKRFCMDAFFPSGC